MPPELPYVSEEAWRNLGREQVSVSDPVSPRQIKEYLAGTGDWHPLHRDPEYAEGTAYGGIVAPPLFFLAACREVVPEDRLGEDGQYRDFGVPGVHGRSLAAGQEYELFAPVRVGDVITTREKVADIQEKNGRSGKLVLVTLETEFENQRGERLASARQTYIFR